FAISSFLSPSYRIRAPAVGERSVFEPAFLARYRFIFNANSIIWEGYQKYKDGAFVVRRLDSDLLVLSNKYLGELRLLPNTKLSNVHAQVENMLGEYTYSSFLLDSDQHVRVLQKHLIPNLKTFLLRAEEELDYSFHNDVPRPDDWTEVDIQEILRIMVARASSKVFIGDPACRDKTWLKLCLEFPINVFMTTFIMRLFPPFLYPIIAMILPPRYWLHRNIKLAKKIITPMIEDYRRLVALKEREGAEEKEKSNLLEWMIDNARGNESDPGILSARLMFLSLASIHSTSSAATNALFDLCSHPEYVEPLREEITEVMGKSSDPSKQDLNKLRKLDSFLKESQRFNPPILLSPQRVTMEDLTLSDGTFVPDGTSIAFPSGPLLQDPNLVPEPGKFDAFRSYRHRQLPGEATRHMMVSTDKDHLYFGHGKQACPGRFFAANEIKLIMVRFLMEFELRLPAGKSRPRNFTIDEMCFTDPWAKLEIRKRRNV
ncbi:putative cytochrome P450, partial [Zopfia rhizophila CBS 207.26]